MYSIAEWTDRYEVSFKGREPKDGEKLRAGPLQFIRLKVYGHRQGTGFRRMQKEAGNKAMEVFGIFCKFLEISGNQPNDKRGTLLNEKDKPATVSDLGFILGIPDSQVENALKVLTSENVGWMTTTQHNTTQPNSIQYNTIQASGKTPDVPGKSGKSKKIKHLDFVLLSEDEHKKLVDQLGEPKTKEAIQNLNDYIGSTGKKYKSHYHTILSWERKNGNNQRQGTQGNQRQANSNQGQQAFNTPEDGGGFGQQVSKFGITANWEEEE